LGEGVKESKGGGDSSMMYLMHCKNRCKCHNVPSPGTTIKKKRKKKNKAFSLKKKCVIVDNSRQKDKWVNTEN
jgi:hypothetical protein